MTGAGEIRAATFNVRGCPLAGATNLLRGLEQDYGADIYLLQETGDWGQCHQLPEYVLLSFSKREGQRSVTIEVENTIKPRIRKGSLICNGRAIGLQIDLHVGTCLLITNTRKHCMIFLKLCVDLCLL